MTIKPARIEELVEQVRGGAIAGWSHETIVQHLRDAGLSKGDAILAFSHGTGTPRSLAIRVVHESQAYAHRKAIDEAWNTALHDLLENEDWDDWDVES